MLTHYYRNFFLITLLTSISAGASLARQADNWTRVKSPNFVVYTNASEKQGREIAYQFETINAVFRKFFNIPASAHAQPVTIIAARDEDTLKTLTPEFWAKKGQSHPAGMYLVSREDNYAAVRLDVTMNSGSDEPYETVYHEYVHYLTRQMIATLPLWMTEGIAEFYGNTRIEGKRVLVGAPSSMNLYVFRQSQPLPLATLFAVNASSPYYHEENKTSIFYAQSWALTHLLITRDWREKTHRFQDFLDLLGQNVPVDKAAEQTIGSESALESALEQYIQHFTFTYARMEAPAEIKQADFQAQAASDAESLTVRAAFMARDRHLPEAQQMLEEALKEDPKSAYAHESMGFVLQQQGKAAESAQWYGQAVALDSKNSTANYFYAMSLLRNQPSDAQAAKAESSLRRAISTDPGFAPAYSALAWVIDLRHEDLNEGYQMAYAAVQLEPGEVHYRLQAARLLNDMGRYTEAVRVATIVANSAKTLQDSEEAYSIISAAQSHQDDQARQKEQAAARQKAMAGRGDESTPGASNTDAGAPPILRHRDADDADIAAPSSPPIVRPEVLPTEKLVEGTIQQVACSGASSMEIAVNSATGTVHLFTDNYFRISYSALNFTLPGELHPCTDSKGRDARITYHPAKASTSQGEMLEVEFVK